jgi:hypothetical protein
MLNLSLIKLSILSVLNGTANDQQNTTVFITVFVPVMIVITLFGHPYRW